MTDLISYAEIKDFLDLENFEIEKYPGLAVILDSVKAAFESYTGRLFDAIERTRIIYIEDFTKIISLEGIPATSISSITDENDSAITAYKIREYGIKLTSGIADNKLIIVYTGGLSTIPDDIKRAALIQTAYEFQTKEQIGAETVSTEGGSVTRPPLQLLAEVKRILNNYKHPLRIM